MLWLGGILLMLTMKMTAYSQIDYQMLVRMALYSSATITVYLSFGNYIAYKDNKSDKDSK
jgi:hypothetical protein